MCDKTVKITVKGVYSQKGSLGSWDPQSTDKYFIEDRIEVLQFTQYLLIRGQYWTIFATPFTAKYK